ncbi:hypothetical protein R1sor_015843 [Riccia sorocarpa]|uniref:Uncharacterized protein n=1 Tax=Riccia sorocarpa TaxID=122646 RepID=A0ABD3HGF5_9MARC
MNSIEELPWTVGKCTSLVELRADFNQLKALPETVGQLKNLKVLSSLTELYEHFNQLETLAENLCCVTTLQKLDASSNFADLEACLSPAIQLIAAMDGERRELKWWSRSHRLIRNAQLQKDFRVREFAEEEHTVTLPRVYDVGKSLVSRLP